MERAGRQATNPQARIRYVSKGTVAFGDVGTVLKVMDVDITTNIGVNFDGVKGVLTDVIVSQRQVNLAWNDGFSFLWVETNIQVGVFEDVNRLVGLDFAKVHVAHADADATLVLTAFR